MKRMIIFGLTLCCIFICSVTFAETNSLAGQYLDRKLYVEPGTVHVTPNGIFLSIEGNFVPVSGVCVDEGGVYVFRYEAKRMVYCPECGRNYNSDRYSSRCPHTDEWCKYSS